MATNTTNYNLVKPAYTDTADIMDINDNMDTIDAKLKELEDEVTATVPVSKGGTGATTAGGARENLGLGTMATLNSPLAVNKGGTGSTSASAARTALGLGSIATVDSPVPVANGGTGATTAANARTNLGLGTMATVNSPVPVANGGTGSTTQSGARTNLGLGSAATVSVPISVANGGTGSTTAANARTALGLGTIATLNTPLAVNKGGTGGTTASTARSNLGAAASTILDETNTSGTNNNITWAAYKSGKTVMLKFATGSGGLNTSVTQNSSFFTVTSGYRPVSLVYFAIRYDTGFQVGTVGTDGTVKMSTSAATNGKGIYGTVTYLTA